MGVPVDSDDVGAFRCKVAADVATAAHLATLVLGDRLGLWPALAQGAATAEELARRTGCEPAYVREWLVAQHTGGYCQRDENGRFELSAAQAAVLADPESPAFLTGAAVVAGVLHKDEDLAVEAFRTGRGIGWHEHDDDLFRGTDQLSAPSYREHLVHDWLPTLDGMVERLAEGISVADVGCGRGAAAVLLAEAFPNSVFVGFDNHHPSIDLARRRARDAGVGDRVRFETMAATGYPGSYELVCAFDVLHDMADPVGVARHIRRSLTGDGTLMLIEPMAIERCGADMSVASRYFTAVSALVSLPHARSQSGPYELGNQVPDSVWARLLGEAGFTRFRRTTETEFARVFEVRP
ncbi:class I SAM-dependent methyltransferase [Phytoactinopolyspora alkaliphila]|uniref:Class I SAM-dependent methyltransferase n=1 Tax=Phytoactinopolyspora alkaliphila TaxID=1783498 RepID=A0A6N9YQN7_9ACTN|nr:class I SAM-dependent methyltransferase [Phytoactinopolyspora alkaliphila]NED97371.1 class I SAM-dependent methyltransferase [Phytoactinopolyspora alkaliphila]